MSIITCPHCQTFVSIDYNCSNCQNILPITISNPFDILDLKQKFDLSKDDIQAALIKKLNFYHPDKFVNSTSANKEIATQNTALLNQAAGILKNDIKRAEILLSIQGENINDTVNADILLASLALQEEIDIASTSESCKTILSRIQKELFDNYQKITNAFNQNNLKNAKELCKERNFLVRAKINIEEKLN